MEELVVKGSLAPGDPDKYLIGGLYVLLQEVLPEVKKARAAKSISYVELSVDARLPAAPIPQIEGVCVVDESELFAESRSEEVDA